MPRFSGELVEAQPTQAGGRFGGQVIDAPAPAPAPSARRPSIRDRIVDPQVYLDALGKTGRVVAQGVGGLLDFGSQVADAALAPNPANPIGTIGGGIRAIMGETGRAITGTNPMQMAPVRPQIERALTEAGVPEYKGPIERIIGAAGEGAITAPLTGGASLVPVTAGAAAGAGGQAAAEAGLPEWAQFLASVGAGMGAARGLSTGRRLPPAPELADVVRKAEARGLTIRPESRLRGAPGTGAQARYQQDVDKFTDEIGKTIGAPEGTPPAQAYAAAERRNNAEFDWFGQNVPFDLDPKILTKIANYRNTRFVLGGAEDSAARAIDEFLNEAVQVNQNGRIPGELWKRLDTELGKVPFDKTSSPGLKEFKDELTGHYKAGMTSDQRGAFTDLMRRYGDMRTVEPLYAKLAATDYRINPKEVLSRTTADKRGKRITARGARGDLGELAEIGQAMTPPRQMGLRDALGALGAGGVVGGTTMATAGAPAALAALGGGYGIVNLLGRLADRPFTATSNVAPNLLMGAAPVGVQATQPRRGR